MSSQGRTLFNDAKMKAQVAGALAKEQLEKGGEKSKGAGECISNKTKAAKEGTRYRAFNEPQSNEISQGFPFSEDAFSKTGEKMGETYDTKETTGLMFKSDK